MSILDTLMGQQSDAFKIAESANRFGDIAKAAELAVSVGAGARTQAQASHISAISAAQKTFPIAFEPASAMAAQLQLFDNKMLAALAPIKEATEKMSALSAALKINTSFHDLGKAPAFTQIRLFEKITGECLLKFDEGDLLKKIGQSNSSTPINSAFKAVANFAPTLPLPDDSLLNYIDEGIQRHNPAGAPSRFTVPKTTCRTKHTPYQVLAALDHTTLLSSQKLTLEERGRAFILSGLPFSHWNEYFSAEDFNQWTDNQINQAKRYKEFILSIANKIKQAMRRACRLVQQARRRLTKSWRTAPVFSWRYAHLNQIHTLKEAEIKLHNFFISITSRLAREPSFSNYEFPRKYHRCI